MLVLKTYTEIKTHYSEEIEDKVFEGERYNDDNGVWGWVVER